MTSSTGEVFVDFNDLGRDHRHLHACYPEHVRNHATLVPGQPVILTDCESVECDGIVAEIYNRGRGDLVSITVTPGTFRDPTTGWTGQEIKRHLPMHHDHSYPPVENRD